MDDRLAIAQQQVAHHAEAIARIFQPGALVTVLVRNPDGERALGAQDFMLTSDTMEEILALVARRAAVARAPDEGEVIPAGDLAPAEPRALARSIAEIEAWERDGIVLCEIENETSFSESVALCLHELKRLRTLSSVVQDTLWMACRYAHGRQSYAVAMYNAAARRAAAVGALDSRPARQEPIYALDGSMSPAMSGLSEDEFGMALAGWRSRDAVPNHAREDRW